MPLQQVMSAVGRAIVACGRSASAGLTDWGAEAAKVEWDWRERATAVVVVPNVLERDRPELHATGVGRA